MAYRQEQNGDIVIDGWENGIASSPLKGLANIQGANIYTAPGEVLCSFNRILQSQVAVGTLTLTRVNTNTVSFSSPVLVGCWIKILVDSGTGLSGNYYVVSAGKLSATFAQDNTTIVTGINAGTATFSVYQMSKPLFTATEPYVDASNVQQYRYYVAGENFDFWVHDTATLSGVDTPLWFMYRIPFGSAFTLGRKLTGFTIFNGWILYLIGNTFYCQSTSLLSSQTISSLGSLMTITDKIHYTLNGHQGKLYWTDGNYIGSLFPNTSLLTGGANIQSYCAYSAVTTTGTITNVIGGTTPTLNSTGQPRIPVFFFTRGTLPTAIATNTQYWIENDIGTKTFYVYASSDIVGDTTKLDLQTGASGYQFFNTFCPYATSGPDTYTLTNQRLNLPFYETAQCLGELGNTVVVGCASNVLYPWDQISPLPGDLIPLPENNTVSFLTVNNVMYVFSGQKGNIYITNGSSASRVLSVPDYCAGVPGIPASYIEPYFTWGGVMYCRGRVYFSILDQTATKAGNCGGIWSFVPNQNSVDESISLRLENQASYGDYNGVSNILINSMIQTAIGPQYWNAWTSSVSSPLYGIDFSDVVPQDITIIESDLIPTGTMLEKKTYSQVEYKLSNPLTSGEAISVYYRLNSTDVWSSLSLANTEASNISGYFTVSFQLTQWLQLRVVLTSTGDATSSFCRLKEVRIK